MEEDMPCWSLFCVVLHKCDIARARFDALIGLGLMLDVGVAL